MTFTYCERTITVLFVVMFCGLKKMYICIGKTAADHIFTNLMGIV